MDRFTRGERLTLAAAVTVAAGAGIFAWTNFTRAFPEAHLSFTVNRATSEPVATAFLAEHAPAAAGALAGRSHAAIFRVDDGAKVYLEREVGLDRLGVLTRERQVRLWSWAHRWYQPLAKEEVRVQVTPEGEVMGFAHLVPEEAGGASLDEAAARAAAETFLASAFKLDPGKLTFVESKREDRPHRRDWTFTYERTGWKVKDATYRMQVEVHGDEPAGYEEYLKVPDAWTQGYQRLRSANDTTALVAAFGIVLTLLAALVVVFREGRRGNVHWRLPMLLTALAFGLFVLMSLNELPVASYGFDTTGTYGAFLAGQLLRAIGGAGVQALLIFLVVAAGEPLFRARFPGHLRITALFERSGWRNRRFAYGLILGYCLAAVFLAYQVAFYLVGARFGAWNPADVPFDNLLNTSFPWLAVLFVGFYPAVSEEFMSRVFSIPRVDKRTHSRVASVVIPALIWGFAHANYPAQPVYIRGAEVSIAGLFVGIILYRFGVVPCLVWHYVVDAGYTSMLLVRSGNPYFVVTALAGVGALLVPLAATLIAAWRRGGFVDDPGALNAAGRRAGGGGPDRDAAGAARRGDRAGTRRRRRGAGVDGARPRPGRRREDAPRRGAPGRGRVPRRACGGPSPLAFRRDRERRRPRAGDPALPARARGRPRGGALRRRGPGVAGARLPDRGARGVAAGGGRQDRKGGPLRPRAAGGSPGRKPPVGRGAPQGGSRAGGGRDRRREAGVQGGEEPEAARPDGRHVYVEGPEARGWRRGVPHRGRRPGGRRGQHDAPDQAAGGMGAGVREEDRPPDRAPRRHRRRSGAGDHPRPAGVLPRRARRGGAVAAPVRAGGRPRGPGRGRAGVAPPPRLGGVRPLLARGPVQDHDLNPDRASPAT